MDQIWAWWLTTSWSWHDFGYGFAIVCAIMAFGYVLNSIENALNSIASAISSHNEERRQEAAQIISYLDAIESALRRGPV